jgi:hypothetical protein
VNPKRVHEPRRLMGPPKRQDEEREVSGDGNRDGGGARRQKHAGKRIFPCN